MKNNILIIVVVTLVAIGVIAAVIFAGFSKDSKTNSSSSGIPDWGASTEYTVSSAEQSESSAVSSIESLPSSESSVRPTESIVQSSSSSDNSSVSSVPSTSEFSAADGIMATASSLIGVPFVLGGYSPDGFDNPGFIYYVLRENGFHNCAHSTYTQSQMGQKLSYSELKPGDLIFFYDSYDSDVGFGGIYMGNGEMIASITPTNREPGVMLVDVTQAYYQRKFFCGVSLS